MRNKYYSYKTSYINKFNLFSNRKINNNKLYKLENHNSFNSHVSILNNHNNEYINNQTLLLSSSIRISKKNSRNYYNSNKSINFVEKHIEDNKSMGLATKMDEDGFYTATNPSSYQALKYPKGPQIKIEQKNYQDPKSIQEKKDQNFYNKFGLD